MEIWKKHPGSGLFVSTFGRVRKGRLGVASYGYSNKGYKRTRTMFKGETAAVHILVLETFRSEHNRLDGYYAHWLDGDKKQNRLQNLQWKKVKRHRRYKRSQARRLLRPPQADPASGSDN